jgi:alpha-galactosidase/6-phospho-beta-glucosidase family protein
MSSNSIVLIGAGSTVFTPGLLTDLASSPVFDEFTVHLVDLEAEAAEVMAALGRRIAQQRGSRLRVEAHTDRREALAGARFVATTIAVGSADGWRADLDVPERHGIQQTVGDSVGPGGVLRALRHVPELVAIAEDVVDLAPKAWLVNYSNPLTANVRAVTSQTDVRAVGLCHGTMHTKAQLCHELGLDPGAVRATFAGLNHLCWLLDIEQDGTDLYPQVRELVQQTVVGERAAADGVHGQVSADLMRRYGLYPAPGDRHVAEFFADYLTLQADGELAWGLGGGLDMTRQYIAEKGDLWDRLREQAAGRTPIDAMDNQEAERLVSIAEAMVVGRDHRELAVNVPNAGKIPNLPPWAVVEVPAVVGAAGITGVDVGRLPEGIAQVLTARAEQQELTVQAAVTGIRELAVEALTKDPLVPDRATAVSVLDQAVQAHAPLLDRFAARAA